MHIRRISVAKYPYPYPFKQGNYYPNHIRIRENCGYPQNIYPRIHIRASLVWYTSPYVPLDTVEVISETGALCSDVHCFS